MFGYVYREEAQLHHSAEPPFQIRPLFLRDHWSKVVRKASISLSPPSFSELPDTWSVPTSHEEAVGASGQGRLPKEVEASRSGFAQGDGENRGEQPLGVDLLDPGCSRTRECSGADSEKE
jgi:hypothetical protein